MSTAKLCHAFSIYVELSNIANNGRLPQFHAASILHSSIHSVTDKTTDLLPIIPHFLVGNDDLCHAHIPFGLTTIQTFNNHKLAN